MEFDVVAIIFYLGFAGVSLIWVELSVNDALLGPCVLEVNIMLFVVVTCVIR